MDHASDNPFEKSEQEDRGKSSCIIPGDNIQAGSVLWRQNVCEGHSGAWRVTSVKIYCKQIAQTDLYRYMSPNG